MQRAIRQISLIAGIALLPLGVAQSAGAQAFSAAAESEASTATDEEDADYTRDGGWVGVGGAFAKENFDRRGRYDDGSVLTFRAGLRGYGFVGAELIGEVLPGFDGRGQAKDVDGFTVSANLKLFWPLGRFEPYASAGIGFLDIDRDDRKREDDLSFRWGVGGDFYLTPSWAIYAEAVYLLPTGDVSRYDYSSYGGGVLYRF